MRASIYGTETGRVRAIYATGAIYGSCRVSGGALSLSARDEELRRAFCAGYSPTGYFSYCISIIAESVFVKRISRKKSTKIKRGRSAKRRASLAFFLKAARFMPRNRAAHFYGPLLPLVYDSVTASFVFLSSLVAPTKSMYSLIFGEGLSPVMIRLFTADGAPSISTNESFFIS